MSSDLYRAGHGARSFRHGHTHNLRANSQRGVARRGAYICGAELPLFGNRPEAMVRCACAELTCIVNGPWVVPSSGVTPDAFPQAVEWACWEGASGFLAGRAVWRMVIGHPDVEAALQKDAVVLLQRLCDVVDETVGG
ncbi:MAG: hypothetical protein EBY30_01975 [Rhodospirillales bacterium]|nr:hypothetical protein [Rhodospirillales bacterium]